MATKAKLQRSSLLLKPNLLLSLFFLLLLLWLLIFLTSKPSLTTNLNPQNNKCNPNIAPFYIHTLPPNFNQALLQNCRNLNMYTSMCPHVANRGLGRPLNSSWYATHQFMAEMIFHARAELHPCRTLDHRAAKLFYVPFYGGLYGSSQFREANLTARDELGVELGDFLVRQPSWRRMCGRDHFLAIGRTSWDFMRASDAKGGDFGANRLLLLPPVLNMSVLTIERHTSKGHNQFGIPYPSYFHPLTHADVAHWQDSIRQARRTHLFSFLGGPRVSVAAGSLRDTILRQCGESDRCIRVQCEIGSSDCQEPDKVLGVMKRAEFCLQPLGDSFTRRSVFDSVLSGCVPVFFSEHTAYTQYAWYFPEKREEWSVFIEPDRLGQIEEELDRVPKSEVGRMREKLIELIPKVTYKHPNASQEVEFQDAVDVALVELTRHVRSLPPEAKSN